MPEQDNHKNSPRPETIVETTSNATNSISDRGEEKEEGGTKSRRLASVMPNKISCDYNNNENSLSSSQQEVIKKNDNEDSSGCGRGVKDISSEGIQQKNESARTISIGDVHYDGSWKDAGYDPEDNLNQFSAVQYHDNLPLSNSEIDGVLNADTGKDIEKPKLSQSKSHGDESFVSALTEHPSITQPVLDKIDLLVTTTDKDYYIDRTPDQVSNSQQERIDYILPDIIENFADPMETEAEKAILKAIENEQQGLRGNDDIGATSLLSQAIPQNDQHAINMFTSNRLLIDVDVAEEKQQDEIAISVQRSHDEDMTSLLQTSQLPSRRPRLGTTTSTNSKTRRPSIFSKDASHNHQTVSDANGQENTTPVIMNSTKQTIEEALLDTGEQLKQFHIGTNLRASAEFHLGPTSEEATAGAPTSADRFLRNAAVIGQVGGGIYQRRKGREDDEGEDREEDSNAGDDYDKDETTSKCEDIDIENQKTRCSSGCCFGICSGKKQKVDDNADKESSHSGAQLLKNMRQSVFHTKQRITDQAGFFQEFYKPRKKSILAYCKMVTLYVFIPTLVISISLFYADNPAMCTSKAQKRNPEDCSSVSWFLNFLLIRQVILFSFALAIESFVIDYSITRSRFIVNLLGPRFTLWIVGSRGWPFRLFVWSLLDLCLLAGGSRFVNHWLYWQDIMPFFNANNASGNVTENDTYYNFIIIGIVVSLVTTCKRYWLGLSFGQKMYANYGKKLAKIMQDMLAISLIAKLAHDIEIASRSRTETTTPESLGMMKGGKDEIIFGWGAEELSPSSSVDEDDDDDDSKSKSMTTPTARQRIFSKSEESPTMMEMVQSEDQGLPTESSRSFELQRDDDAQRIEKSFVRKAALLESMQSFEQIKMNQLLGDWEEPTIRQQSSEKVSISEILQFRQALAFMDDVYPFSIYFGPANRRDRCAASAESVYERLMMQTPGQTLLPFSTLALLAVDKNGNVDHKLLRRLRKMFRSDKHGNLTPLDFVKNCDAVYKKLRLFRASVANSSQIDEAFERIFNLSFHAIMFFVVLAILGIDTMALFLSLSSVIVGFAFMIGSASAKYFEGVLFVLARRPYEIGDRIHVSNPTQDTNPNGSSSWFVENVDLFTTTVRFATTNEVATYNNGSLASTRIINAARSPNAIVYVYMKFDTDVPQAKIKIFHKTIETFVKSRPRQWEKFSGFRATRIETDLGFIEYVVVATHVEKWQNMLPIVTSKAELASYCLEVSKQLDMKYSAPELPVTLDVKNPLDAKQMLFGGGSGGKGTDVSGFMGKERDSRSEQLGRDDLATNNISNPFVAGRRPPLHRSHKRVNTAFC